MPDISIVITVFNKEAYVENTILSLVGLDDSYRKEFVFVDDASTDGSVKVIEKMAKSLPGEVVLIKNPQNLGPSKTTNLGARAAKGDCIFFIDGDDLLARNAFQIMMGLLKEYNADSIRFESESGTKEEILSKIKDLPEKPKFEIFNNPVSYFETRTFGGPNLGITRELYNKLGKEICDERVFIQDYSMSFRIISESKIMVRLLDAARFYILDIPGQLSKNNIQGRYDKTLYNFIVLDENKLNNLKIVRFYATQLFKIYQKFNGKERKYVKFWLFFLYKKTTFLMSKNFIKNRYKEILEDYRRKPYSTRFMD